MINNETHIRTYSLIYQNLYSTSLSSLAKENKAFFGLASYI